MKTLHRFCLSVILFLSIVPVANSAICDFSQNVGVVKRIYPSFTAGNVNSGTYFTISGTTSAITASTGYYFIPNHENYHEMHDLVLESAKYLRTIQVKTTNCSTATASAVVQYLVMDF